MDAYRKNPVPVIYTQLDYVRAAPPSRLADCLDDLPLLKQLQNVAAGHTCVSTLESPHQLIVKVSFPGDLLSRDGTTGKVIQWRFYYWKLWDAESLVTGLRPAEAVHPINAGIDHASIDSLAHPTSCLPLLRTTKDALDSGYRKGYELDAKTAKDIERVEKKLIARTKLTAMKQLRPLKKASVPKPSNDPQLSARQRDAVLRRDKYRCVFCGQDASMTAIEVNHIVPRNVINKLQLDPSLHTAEVNLCVTCFKCNRGKSDSLAAEDIEFYCNAFSSSEHPNHDVLPHLKKISELQSLREDTT